jgi:hypothetical protein
MENNNIINLKKHKEQSSSNKRLEMILRDSLDNIEDYSFQMYYDCDVDTIIDFEILPYSLPSQSHNIQARA